MDKIRVLIVDDDIIWAKLINSYLNKTDEMLVVGIASNKEEAIRIAQNIKTDIILMDINLTENQRDGIIAAIEIQQFSNSKIIMLTSLNDKELIKDSFTVGAVEFVSKENYTDLPKIIRRSLYGNSPLQIVLEDYIKLKREEQLKDLTPAEKEIYELIESGHSQSQIGDKLSKTENTLKSQVKKILKKLGVSSRKEAIIKVKTKGIIYKEDYKN
ncbi:MAG: DNA-binding response regulator [Clostridiales bacterium GWB2_37_7]|nr:MAG: DNA-binding response regulator [Clostridiales bacterium GWB2_37_7]